MGSISTPAANGGSHPANWVPIKEELLYSRRPLKIICVGAGFSGLTLAHKIKHEHKLEHALDLDIPAHAYTFSFEPNPDWSHFYAPAPEIEAYIKRTTKKWQLDEKIQFNSTVLSATWDDAAGKWKLVIDQAGTQKEDVCDVLVNACGFLNKWKWPKIDGLNDFKSKLMHTANWDDQVSWEGKRVAVIGNGSSGIQTVAAMAPKASRLVNYVRNPTWVSINFLAQHAKDGHNHAYSEEDKQKFKEDPKAFLEFRKQLEGRPDGHMQDPNERSPAFRPRAGRKTYSRSLVGSPGDGYLEAFAEQHVDMCWDPISSITKKGVKTSAGEEEFDVLVCATGFDTSFIPSSKLTGKDGATLEKRWAVDPDAFFSVQVDGMPNYFIFNGPNPVVSHGSVLTNGGFISDYILRWVEKIATEDIKSMDVKPESVSDFNVYTQEFLKRMAWADKCRSWYKNGKESGVVTGTYGGSFLSFKTCLERLGGEHFNFTYNSPNRFRFLGNGEAAGEDKGMGDMAYYMDEYEAVRLRMEKDLGL